MEEGETETIVPGPDYCSQVEKHRRNQRASLQEDLLILRGWAPHIKEAQIYVPVGAAASLGKTQSVLEMVVEEEEGSGFSSVEERECGVRWGPRARTTEVLFIFPNQFHTFLRVTKALAVQKEQPPSEASSTGSKWGVYAISPNQQETLFPCLSPSNSSLIRSGLILPEAEAVRSLWLGSTVQPGKGGYTVF